jgi:DNA-binding transcriptional LysR family regulator
MSVPAQIAALLDSQLDVGFVRPPVDDAALNSEIVISEPFVVALPPTHHFASRPRLQLSALANEPFVLPPRDAVPMFHDAVLRACREAGFVPHAPHEVDHLHMVIRMVAAGAGVALVPASARKVNQGRVIYRALRPSPDPLQTAIAWRREDTSATLAEFISVARRSLHHLRE